MRLLNERTDCARNSSERLESQQTGERTGSRPPAAEGGGAKAPALRPADLQATSTQLLLGEPAFCHRRFVHHLARELDACIGAPGPHHFAVRQCAARQSAHPRPPPPASRVVTIAIRPLCRGGMDTSLLIFGKLQAQYFRNPILNRLTRLIPRANFQYARTTKG
jgi:hypothetical protein